MLYWTRQNEEILDMDFVDWCSFVLNKMIEISENSLTVRSRGVDTLRLARILYCEEVTNKPEFQESHLNTGIRDAIYGLRQVGLIEKDKIGFWWKVTNIGQEYAMDITPLWYEICQIKLKPEQEQLLRLINRLSSHTATDHAWLESITHEPILDELKWPEGIYLLGPVVQELIQLGLVVGSAVMGHLL